MATAISTSVDEVSAELLDRTVFLVHDEDGLPAGRITLLRIAKTAADARSYVQGWNENAGTADGCAFAGCDLLYDVLRKGLPSWLEADGPEVNDD